MFQRTESWKIEKKIANLGYFCYLREIGFIKPHELNDDSRNDYKDYGRITNAYIDFDKIINN